MKTPEELKEYNRKYRERHSPWHNQYRFKKIPFDPFRLIDDKTFDKNFHFLLYQRITGGNDWMFGGEYNV